MALTITTWTLGDFVTEKERRRLIVSPEYQRRETWSPRKKMAFIDSVARYIPVNAITLYKNESSGLSRFEVIDGKQRITALFDYIKNRYAPSQNILKDLSEEEELEGKDLAD